ncbi:DUF742 domain-containing protein [Nocardiopsis xinjiangensis]|uniref:DUF742 domain-containing protein n=1 Tax=Nocardiopsis xinjiangensis TaxID=124285 RepID=UPI00034D33BC|nr:DUF742 domain-containing protein [Nocardiopsis xinjiangensis]
MAADDDEIWTDEKAGRLVRPYTVSNGRTSPTNKLDLLSMVKATGRSARAQLDPDLALALHLCHDPTPVVEVAAHLKLPAVVTKVLLSDLIDCGAATTHAPRPAADPTDRSVLEALLHGLQQRL